MTVHKGAPDGQSDEMIVSGGTPRFPDPIGEGHGGRAPNGEEYD